MKTILTMILCLLLSGCLGNAYEYRTFDTEGRITAETKLSGVKAMVNDSKGVLMIILPDGAMLFVMDAETQASPESAEALGRAIGTGFNAALLGVGK